MMLFFLCCNPLTVVKFVCFSICRTTLDTMQKATVVNGKIHTDIYNLCGPGALDQFSQTDILSVERVHADQRSGRQ